MTRVTDGEAGRGHCGEVGRVATAATQAAAETAEAAAIGMSPGPPPKRMGPILSVMGAWDTLREWGPCRVLPTAVLALMSNAPAATVGIELGARAGIHAPVSA